MNTSTMQDLVQSIMDEVKEISQKFDDDGTQPMKDNYMTINTHDAGALQPIPSASHAQLPTGPIGGQQYGPTSHDSSPHSRGSATSQPQRSRAAEVTHPKPKKQHRLTPNPYTAQRRNPIDYTPLNQSQPEDNLSSEFTPDPSIPHIANQLFQPNQITPSSKSHPTNPLNNSGVLDSSNYTFPFQIQSQLELSPHLGSNGSAKRTVVVNAPYGKSSEHPTMGQRKQEETLQTPELPSQQPKQIIFHPPIISLKQIRQQLENEPNTVQRSKLLCQTPSQEVIEPESKAPLQRRSQSKNRQSFPYIKLQSPAKSPVPSLKIINLKSSLPKPDLDQTIIQQEGSKGKGGSVIEKLNDLRNGPVVALPRQTSVFELYQQKFVKSLVDDLNQDNRTLNDDIDDFRVAFYYLANKHKDLKVKYESNLQKIDMIENYEVQIQLLKEEIQLHKREKVMMKQKMNSMHSIMKLARLEEHQETSKLENQVTQLLDENENLGAKSKENQTEWEQAHVDTQTEELGKYRIFDPSEQSQSQGSERRPEFEIGGNQSRNEGMAVLLSVESGGIGEDELDLGQDNNVPSSEESSDDPDSPQDDEEQKQLVKQASQDLLLYDDLDLLADQTNDKPQDEGDTSPVIKEQSQDRDIGEQQRDVDLEERAQEFISEEGTEMVNLQDSDSPNLWDNTQKESPLGKNQPIREDEEIEVNKRAPISLYKKDEPSQNSRYDESGEEMDEDGEGEVMEGEDMDGEGEGDGNQCRQKITSSEEYQRILAATHADMNQEEQESLLNQFENLDPEEEKFLEELQQLMGHHQRIGNEPEEQDETQGESYPQEEDQLNFQDYQNYIEDDDPQGSNPKPKFELRISEIQI